MTTEPAILTFTQLRERIAAANGRTFDVELAAISDDLAANALRILNHTRFSIARLKVDAADDTRLVFSGAMPVRSSVRGRGGDGIDVEARIFPAGAGIDYLIILSMPGAALSDVSGDLGVALRTLPIKIGRAWCILTSGGQIGGSVDIEGRDFRDILFGPSVGVLRLESPLLERLGLNDAHFCVTSFQAPLSLAVATRMSVAIGGVISLEVTRIAVEGADKVSLEGRGSLQFFRTRLAIDANILVRAAGVAVDIPLGNIVAPFDEAFFRAIRLRDTKAHVQGALTSCSVAMSGKFEIEGSRNSGSFYVLYSAATAQKLIPDLFELEAEKITASDVFTIMTGATVTLPPFMDRIVSLENVYLYYSSLPGQQTRSGLPSVKGVRGHAAVKLFGHRAYGEFEVQGSEARVGLRIDPIDIAGIIRMRGAGRGSPQAFPNVAIRDRAIEIVLDTVEKRGRASFEVALFRSAAVACAGELTESSLEFSVAYRLPILIDNRFDASLRENTVTLRSKVSLSVDVRADWHVGRFRLTKAAQVIGDLVIEAGRAHAAGSAELRISLGPIVLPLSVSFDPRDIDELPEIVTRAVREEVERALGDAVVWLRAVLDGAIEFVGDAANAAARIGAELERTFNRTSTDAAIALRQAGYELNDAYHVLEHGQRLALLEVRNVMVDAAAYTEREVAAWVREMYGRYDDIRFNAYHVGDLLLQMRFEPENVTAEIQDIVRDVGRAVDVLGQLKRPAFEAARILRAAGKGAEEAARILVRAFWDMGRDALGAALKDAKYPVKQAEEVAANLFREGGVAVGNIRDEMRRIWRRYMPVRVTVTFKRPSLRKPRIVL